MNNITQTIKVLEQLGYKPKWNEKKNGIQFTSFGSDAFPENHKQIVRIILGDGLSEFYYGGGNTQTIYFTIYDGKD